MKLLGNGIAASEKRETGTHGEYSRSHFCTLSRLQVISSTEVPAGDSNLKVRWIRAGMIGQKNAIGTH